MSNQPKNIEVKVGLFVFAGLIAIAVMAVQFGRMGQALTEFYTLTVKLPDAGGIIKGSDVLLAGARIGFVADKPQIGESVSSVSVEVKINADITLPRATDFSVGSSGLLGDRFIQVIPDSNFDPLTFDPEDPEQVWNDGDVVEGQRAGGGISELTSKGGVVMDDLRKSLAQIQKAVETFQTGVLSEQNLANLETTFANLKVTSENFVSASDKIDAVVEDAGEVVESAKITMARADDTMETADAAAEDIRKAISDARKAIEDAREVIRSSQEAVEEITHGDGAVARLLTDRELAGNLDALVANLRKHGVLFYRDSAARNESNQRSAPTRKAIPVAPERRGR